MASSVVPPMEARLGALQNAIEKLSSGPTAKGADGGTALAAVTKAREALERALLDEFEQFLE